MNSGKPIPGRYLTPKGTARELGPPIQIPIWPVCESVQAGPGWELRLIRWPYPNRRKNQ